jgi:acylphosphatase
MPNEANHRLHAIVHGLVQGVNFRAYTEREAQRLGVVGWVMNRRDRTVEVTAEGTQATLDSLLSWLHQGSPAARVESVDADWQTATGEFTDFTTRYV